MSFTSEDIVTKILSSKEILNKNVNESTTVPIEYNLGIFLDKQKNTPSVYDVRYKFIQ